MTPEQFNYWFKGACDVIDGVPTPEQWARIREEVGKVGAPASPAKSIGQQVEESVCVRKVAPFYVPQDRLPKTPWTGHPYPPRESVAGTPVDNLLLHNSC